MIDTHSQHFLDVLNAGKVSTNCYLRKLHNFALDMAWCPTPVLPKRQWPKIKFGKRRAITQEEHDKILASEHNPEKKAFYQLCWFLGGSQGDIANLQAEHIDWEKKAVHFRRKKTGTPVTFMLDPEALSVLSDLPGEGLLFPHLATLRASDRGDAFRKRCLLCGIKGVSLHSYRYSMAQRMKQAGYTAEPR